MGQGALPASDLIFIVGRERSGTTVFRDLLMRNGALDCDEIFHGTLNHEYRFYAYVADRVAGDPGLVHPEHHSRLFGEYVTWLRSRAGGQPIAMDVKYFGLNLIPEREAIDGKTFFLANYMRRENANVVHIVRRNKLRILVSERIAYLTGRWSVGRPEHMVRDKPRISIDPMAALQFVSRLVEQDRIVGSVLSKVQNYNPIFYDQMFDRDGMFSTRVQRVASTVMKRDGQFIKPGNMKMNPEPASSLVENFMELSKAFAGSEHEWMLHDNDSDLDEIEHQPSNGVTQKLAYDAPIPKDPPSSWRQRWQMAYQSLWLRG